MKVFKFSPSNKSLVSSTREDVKSFLAKLTRFLKEINIEDEEINNLVSLIEPIVETCQKMSKFSNCTEIKGKLAIMASVSGKAMMVFLGMLNEMMTDGDLAVQNKELIKKVMKINNVKFCIAK